jgi:hypothetical protein
MRHTMTTHGVVPIQSVAPGGFEMAELVNLRTIRKRARREQEEQRAQANRLQFGQNKHASTLAQARRAKANHDLDQHLIDTGDGK